MASGEHQKNSGENSLQSRSRGVTWSAFLSFPPLLSWTSYWTYHVPSQATEGCAYLSEVWVVGGDWRGGGAALQQSFMERKIVYPTLCSP